MKSPGESPNEVRLLNEANESDQSDRNHREVGCGQKNVSPLKGASAGVDGFDHTIGRFVFPGA